MKKMIFLGLLPLSMLLLSFVDSGGTTSDITRLANGNYVFKNVKFSEADEMTFRYLEDEYQPVNEQLGFFWSCYSKTPGGHWEHGRIWGGACCTSGPPKDCTYQFESDVRDQIDAIMAKYMN